jgi:hypothetical protein
MSKSDYQNLKEAYLSNVKPIRENYGQCNLITDFCTEQGQTETTQIQVFDAGSGPQWYDWYPKTCRTDKYTVKGCPKSDCRYSEWTECTNGNQTRKFIPEFNGGICNIQNKNDTSRKCGYPCNVITENCKDGKQKQYISIPAKNGGFCEISENKILDCGTPCEYKEQKGKCTLNANTTITLPCYPSTIHTGTITTDYVKTKDAVGGGSCKIPASTTSNCMTYSCNGENLLKLIIKKNYFTNGNQKETQSFINKFTENVRYMGSNEYALIFGKNASTKFLTEILKYLESAYKTYKDTKKVKCQIENFKLLINSSFNTSLPTTIISNPPTDVCPM